MDRAPDGGLGARECAAYPYGPPPANVVAEPRCAAETRQCMEECTSLGCQGSCAAADATPPESWGSTSIGCAQCLTYESIRCFHSGMCEREVDDFDCCAAQRCPDGSASCIESSCLEELQDLQTCGILNHPECSLHVQPYDGLSLCFDGIAL